MLTTLSSSRSWTRTFRSCSSSRRCSSSSLGSAGAGPGRLALLHRARIYPSAAARARRCAGSPRPPRGRRRRAACPPRARAASRWAPFSPGSSTSSPSASRAGAVHSSSRSSAARVSITSPASKSIWRALEPVADRPPEVLLDLAVAQRLAEPALVVVERRLGDAGGDQRRRGRTTPRRASARRRSAARRCRRRGAGARSTRAGSTRRSSGSGQQVDEARVGGPVAERLVDAAAREGAGEDLGCAPSAGRCRGRRGTASSPRARAAAAGRSRRWSQTAIARSAPRTPTWTCRLQVLLRCATQRSSSRRRL